MPDGFDMFDACATATTLTLFWDKPERADRGTAYTLFVDGMPAARTTRTFATIEGLAPDRRYHVELRACFPEGASAIRLAEGSFRTETVKRDIDVSRPPYNAVGDGVTMNTRAIQQALDDCDASSRVVIPAGVFLTGALTMHSESELHVKAGGVVQGSVDPSDYEPRVWSRFEGVERECYASLVNIGVLDHTAGPTTHDVRLSGEGAIRGGGARLMRATIDRERVRMGGELDGMADYIAACENEDTVPARARGRLISICNAERVELAGLAFEDGPGWNIHCVYSRHVVTHGAMIRSCGVWNGDGWDPDSSEDCVLFDTTFDTGDDMVAIKSGKNPEGNRINRPTRRVRIFSCSALGGHGIAIGSEISGGVEDVRIWDVDLARSRYGIHIKATAKRGGYVRDVSVRDSTVAAVTIHSVSYNDDGESGPDQPYFERFRFERLHALGRYWGETADDVYPSTAVLVKGFDKPGHEARDIVFKDVTLGGVDGGCGRVELCDCAGVVFDRVDAASNPVTDPSRPFKAAAA
ncbi:glycosyl hydrolase family 28 protein [Bifidobacterium eulemuris]|uniref:Glycoside hydrolase family 28 protein n=1 Tax=Bifidobacterium eulemuris TaxID=1765219 RepID=A0A261G7R7_9BIFI|nr:glycosyl hydrolase family 28 protein [Bifidobacterium eulemuris]OZG67487.1 polygalacturonase [Bifidobacterium eulemuris]QOL33043.1 glycoside hydrolase family 28 protein [Bifidobacterium eulemuris]